MARIVRVFRDRDLGTYVSRCLDAGFTAEVCGDGHVRLTAPDGRRAKVSVTQFSGPATHQAIARLRRIGGPKEKK